MCVVVVVVVVVVILGVSLLLRIYGLPFSSLESLYSNTLRTYTTGQVLQAFLNLGYRPP